MATPRPDENEISTTTFLIGAVVVVGVFVAIQIGRSVMGSAEAPAPPPVVEPDAPPADEDPEELTEPPPAVEPPYQYDPPIEGEVEFDEDRKRFVVALGFGSEDERAILKLEDIQGLEREPNGELNLRARDGRRVTVTQEFIDGLPTRVRYGIDYEASGNVPTDGEGNPLDDEGRPLTSDSY